MKRGIKDIDIKLVNVKTFQGHDGVGINADIVYKGMKIAHAYDDARGGGMDITIDGIGTPLAPRNKMLLSQLEAECRKLPQWKSKELKKSFDMTVDLVVDYLVDEISRERKWKQECRKGILVGDKEDSEEYTILSYQKSLSALVEQYGKDMIAVIQREVAEVKARGKVVLNKEYLAGLGVKFE